MLIDAAPLAFILRKLFGLLAIQDLESAVGPRRASGQLGRIAIVPTDHTTVSQQDLPIPAGLMRDAL